MSKTTKSRNGDCGIEALGDFEVVYLATPYAKHPGGHEAAFIEACKLAGELVLNWVGVYCPIVHGHPLSVHADVPYADYSIWLPLNYRMAKKADALVIGKLKSWEQSIGIAEETKFFFKDGKPIFLLDPDTLAIDRIEP